MKAFVSLLVALPDNLDKDQASDAIEQGHILQNRECGFEDDEIEQLRHTAAANQEILQNQIEDS